AGAIGLNSSPGLLAIARNTIATMQRWQDFNGSNSFFPAAVRVGYNPDTILGQLRIYCSNMYPNGFRKGNPHGIENCSTVPNTINEMLCMSNQDLLRVFEVWPKNRDATFYNIRSEGAFLVSAQMKKGRVEYVRVFSEKGHSLVLQNPWPGKTALIISNKTAPRQSSGECITVNTRKGEELMITEDHLQLEPLNGSLVLTTRRYDGLKVVGEDTLYPFPSPEVAAKNAMRVQVLSSSVPEEPGAIDITVSCKATAALPATAVAASFTFSDWNPANYVLVPAAVYNGNRYRAIGNGYDPAYPKDMYYNPSVPLTISNNPRLALDKGEPSLIELQTGNTSTPAMCFFSARAKKGFIVLTTQGTRLGANGLTVAENAPQDTCSFQVSAPSMRKLAAGFGDFHPSGDKAPDWAVGDSVTLRFRVFVFDAPDIPALLRKFFNVRKSLSGPNQPRDLLPKSQQFKFGTDISRSLWSENPAGNYYLPENSRNFQLGWVGGLMNTLPLLALDSPVERERVGQEFDFVVHKLQGRSGFFYGGITADGHIEAEKMNPDFPAIQAMVRKNGDALFWMIKQLELLRAQGHGAFIKADWKASARKLAEAFVRTWKRYGQFGQYIVPDNGDIAVFNSAAGTIAPAGLVLAYDYFKEPEFLTVAKASAAYYYRQFVVKQGLTGGNCGDISQDADSESAFAFLESLMALYHATGDRVWLERAETEAALCSTWTLSYDEKFPPGSDIDRLGAHMAGAVFASIQNKHAAPGICTSSGDYLFKLYRATGNMKYADLIRDIQQAAAEAVNRPGHLTTRNLIGSSMERIQPSDAEGRRATGNFINTRNTWTETDGVMMALELPGVYVQTDTKRMVVFDQVSAKLSSAKGGGLTLTLDNPTAYDASVSVMAETSRQATIPMGYTGFLTWPMVRVKAGGRTIVHIGPGFELPVK
ncbi:MAG TPA: hypothetical protein VGS79_23245, partial [Puia sp.]|nr:hypothetical protein [Puia sp.]